MSTPIRSSGPTLALLVALLLPLALATPVARAAPSPASSSDTPVGVWPLAPGPDDVLRRFDPPSGPYGAGHRGVDLAGRVGEPVRTALPGTVLYAGRIAGVGIVTVSHGDTRTTYEPVTAEVRRGDVVAAGGRIGVLDLGGSHCFPRACLHWGWIRGSEYLDPLLLVGDDVPGPVRLLPWGGAAPAAPAAPVAPAVSARPATVFWVPVLQWLGRIR